MALDAGLLIDSVPSTTGGTAENTVLLTSVANVGFIPINTNENIVELGVKVAVASTTAAFAVSFFDRPCAGSATGEVLIGTVTAPSTTQATCTTVRKYVNYNIAKCHWIRVAVVTLDATATAVIYVKGYPSGESGAEPTDVDSTT